jgi:drug/metabolite transporter (DMT)-like permease
VTASRIATLLFIAVLLTAGQLLFKMAATRLDPTITADTLFRLITDRYLIAGVVAYGLATVVWILVLTDGSLGRSYAFVVATTLLIVPVAGNLIFSEPLSPGMIIGGILIIVGLVIISSY